MRHNQPTNSSASNQEKYRHKKTPLSKEKLQKHKARAARTEPPFEQPLGEDCLSTGEQAPNSGTLIKCVSLGGMNLDPLPQPEWEKRGMIAFTAFAAPPRGQTNGKVGCTNITALEVREIS